MRFDAIIAAAGSGTRFGGDKIKLFLGEATVLERAVRAFYSHPLVDKIIIGVSPSEFDFARAATAPFDSSRIIICAGGDSRGATVRNALALSQAEGVLVHDGARPFVSPELIGAVCAAVESTGSGVPARPLSDSVRFVQNGSVVADFDREKLVSVSTPQGFARQKLLEAFDKSKGRTYTDESGLYAAHISPVTIVKDEIRNTKITTLGDYIGMNSHIGIGYDSHRLSPGRPLFLCGVRIAETGGAIAHSDGDAAVHALIDAMLSAIGERGIGVRFPDSDPRFLNADSLTLLDEVAALYKQKNFALNNLSITIVLERPKLDPHIPLMREVLAARLGINKDSVAVAAKTNEGLGAEGMGEAVTAYAAVSVN